MVTSIANGPSFTPSTNRVTPTAAGDVEQAPLSINSPDVTAPTMTREASLEASDARAVALAGTPYTQHLQGLTAPGDAELVAAGRGGPALPSGYGNVERLAQRLPSLDPRFGTDTPKERATMALALLTAGTETIGKGTQPLDVFNIQGGSGGRMRGPWQFDNQFHASRTRTPEGQAKLMADMMTGVRPLPNSKGQADYASKLVRAVESGQVTNEASLKRWVQAQGLAGTNWQGLDDGWKRVPGFGDAVVKFIQEGLRSPTQANA